MVKKHTSKQAKPVPKPFVRSVSVNLPDRARAYPFNIPAIAMLNELQMHADVTFLVGENGSGKSTLLEAIAISMGFNEEGGSIDHSYDHTSTSSELKDAIYVKKGLGKPVDSFFLRAESFYNFATFIEEHGNLQRYGGSLHGKSHGESFLSLLVNRFGGNGLYILDEPEAALSPSRQLAALVRLHDLVRQNSQFIIATHSPILMAYPNARIIQLDENGWHEIAYVETQHFQVTKYFLNNYGEQLKRLLSDDNDKTGEPERSD